MQPIRITNGDSNLPIDDLLTPVTIILLSIKLNKMFNIKTSQILRKKEFTKRTNTLSWEACDHAKILTKSISSD